MTPLPVACRLSAVALHEREATLLRRFLEAVTERREIASGIEFRMPGDRERLETAAALLAAERECCRFLRFELHCEPGLGPLTLRVTGPEGSREFLRELLGI